jgi:hypothetical protein
LAYLEAPVDCPEEGEDDGAISDLEMLNVGKEPERDLGVKAKA